MSDYAEWNAAFFLFQAAFTHVTRHNPGLGIMPKIRQDVAAKWMPGLSNSDRIKRRLKLPDAGRKRAKPRRRCDSTRSLYSSGPGS